MIASDSMPMAIGVRRRDGRLALTAARKYFGD
jgi:hypothetical protein